MIEFLKKCIDNWEIIATFLTIVSTIIGFIVRGYLKILGVTQTIHELKNVPTHINEIKAELQTNGGKSLKDTINRIENRQCREAEKARITMDNEEHIYFETDGVGGYIYVSEHYAIMVGHAPQEFLGNGWKAFIHPCDREDVTNEWTSATKEERIFEYKFRYINNMDQPIPAFVKAYPIYSGEKKILGWFGVVKILTEIPKEWQD